MPCTLCGEFVALGSLCLLFGVRESSNSTDACYLVAINARCMCCRMNEHQPALTTNATHAAEGSVAACLPALEQELATKCQRVAKLEQMVQALKARWGLCEVPCAKAAVAHA